MSDDANEVEIEFTRPVGPRVTYTGGQEIEDIEAEVPDGWAIDWSSAQQISPPRTTPIRYSAPLVEVAEKRRVSRWETVATFVATYEITDGEDACDVEVQIGRSGASWFLRTSDDANGDDDFDDTAYPTEDAARAAAEAFAAERDEADDGEDAAAYLDRKLRERIGPQDRKGAWGVYWSTRGEGSRCVERYATQEQAEAACERANRQFDETYPGGNYLCCYEVRVRLDGRWVRPDDEDGAWD